VSAALRADLALVGFGNVGRRFASLLAERRDALLAGYGIECRIVGIATRRSGARFDASGLDPEVDGGHVLDAPGRSAALQVITSLARSTADLRVVVETTTLDVSTGQPALNHVRAALDAGCHVITANKGPVAFAYSSLRRQALAAGVSFLFEGAVMDGVPIFSLVRETLPLVTISGFRGVVNSTTNHILTAMEQGEDFNSALARMQAEGIAEGDPSLDIDGWDAAAKTAALANVMLDAGISPLAVRRTGIGAGDSARARDARARGLRLKLVASASRDREGCVRASVDLTELPASDLLAGLDGKANALILQTDLLDEIAIGQLDGNLTQTAYALLSDLVTIAARQGRRESPARPIPERPGH
jgi:homoserine dehydrogenase